METLDAPNARWADSLEGNVNLLYLLMKVGRPTFGELGETGMSLDSYGDNI